MWRNALLYRYSAISDNGIEVEIDEYDADNANIYLVPELLTTKNPPPPPQLAKTVIRLFYQGAKLVTLTLYSTVTSAGTLLCQGKECPAWDSKECDALRDIVTSFRHNEDLGVVTQSLLRIPFTLSVTEDGSSILKPPQAQTNPGGPNPLSVPALPLMVLPAVPK